MKAGSGANTGYEGIIDLDHKTAYSEMILYKVL